MEGEHLLLLYMKDGVRNYVNKPTEAAVCEHIIQLCEEHQIAELQERGRRLGTNALPEVVQYDAADLLNFLDIKLAEVAVLRYSPAEMRYEPMGRNWTKNRLYEHLRGLVGKVAAPQAN